MTDKYTLGGDPPQSRSEKILMKQNPGPAQSRIEELLKHSSSGRTSGAFVYKGSVETALSLPPSNNEVGDVYHVNSDGSEWAWSGSDWEELGKPIPDGSGLPDTTSASAGDFLRLDAQKNAVWETIPSVMGTSIPLGD